MKKITLSFLGLLVASTTVFIPKSYCQPTETEKISWNNSLTLPPLHEKPSPGVAGAFSGFIGNYLIVAGGANFPDCPPWEGGKKQWWQTLYYKDVTSEAAQWQVLEKGLPRPLAYGITIQLPEGLLCIGGCDEQQCYSDVFLIRLENNVPVVSKEWPALPIPLANATGTLLHKDIYIAGGQESMKKEEATAHFYKLNLQDLQKGWQELPAWPGAPRGYAVSVAQNNGNDLCYYLFSGRNYRVGGKMDVLTDGYAYTPRLNTWQPVQGEFPVMAGNAIAIGNDQILFLGGVPRLLPASDQHPGFDNSVRLYNTTHQTFVERATCPFAIPVTTTVARKGNLFYMGSGEIKPGIRTPHLLRGEIDLSK